MAKPPFWNFYPREYPYNPQEERDVYGTIHRVPRRPARLVAGLVINHVQILHIERKSSAFYNLKTGYGIKRSRHMHLTGPVHCKCLLCGKPFITHYTRLHPNRPDKSLWACKCQRRPQGTGVYAMESAMKRGGPVVKKTVKAIGRGRQPVDLTEQMFGWLEPFEWIPGRGWLCLCHGCNNPEGFIVPHSFQLEQGTMRCCGQCREKEIESIKDRTATQTNDFVEARLREIRELEEKIKKAGQGE